MLARFASSFIMPLHRPFAHWVCMLPLDEVVVPLAVHDVEKDLQKDLQGLWHQGGKSTGTGTITPDTTASSRPALFRGQ